MKTDGAINRKVKHFPSWSRGECKSEVLEGQALWASHNKLILNLVSTYLLKNFTSTSIKSFFNWLKSYRYCRFVELSTNVEQIFPQSFEITARLNYCEFVSMIGKFSERYIVQILLHLSDLEQE